MKRLLFILMIGLLAPCFSKAQGKFYPSRPHYKTDSYDGFVYGIKGGVNIPRLYYTNPSLSRLGHDTLVTPSASFFLEIPFGNWTVAPELNYQRRGGSTSYVFSDTYKESYKLQADYVSLRSPLCFYIPLFARFKPYLFVGPDFGWVVGGSISLENLDEKQPENKKSVSINGSNMKRYYLGALGGLGFCFMIPLDNISIVIKTDAALNWGFNDTYSKLEHTSEANPLNVQAYSIKDSRYSRGLEIHLSLGFFFNKQDACGKF